MKKILRSSKLQCAFCQGKGLQPGTERLSCIVCGGRGRVMARQPYNVCKECEGMGKKKGTNLYCLSCHGKGFVEETKYPLMAAPSIGKRETRARRKKSVKVSKIKIRKSLKLGRSRIKKIKRTTKKGKSSFFKKLLGSLKIL